MSAKQKMVSYKTHLLLLNSSSFTIPPGSPVIDGPQVVVQNSQITLTCTSARGDPPPTVKWLKDDTEITTGVSTTTAGTTVTTSLTFTATKDDHLEVYECQAENGVLQNPLSTTKFVEVHYSPDTPTFDGPSNLTPGQQGLWTCMSSNGFPAGVMSMRNQNKNTQFTSEFTSYTVLDQKSYDVTGTLTWSPVIVNNGDTICCDVTHTTTLGSTPQTVCRQITVARTPPVTTIPQPSYNQSTGQQIVLGCSISSPNSALLDVHWTFANDVGQVTDPILISISNGKYSGSTTSSPSLIINNVTTTDQGIYSCKARNSVGNSTNNPTTNLTITGSLPVVEISPTTYNTAIGDQVTIHCNIVSDSAGVNEVYWQTTSNNQLRLIYNGDIGYQGSTPTTPSLTINFASINDTGTYTCHATNDQGTGNSNTGNVTVTGGYLFVSVTPRNSNVSQDNSQIISCNVTGIPPSTCITWLFTPAGSTQPSILSTTNSNKYTVGTQQEPYLTIFNFEPGDSGTYVCRATNAVGSSSSYPGSTLNYISAPITSVEPNQYAAFVEDDSFQIQCNVTATPGAFDWYWTFQPKFGSVETIRKGTNSQEYIIENSGTNPHLTIRNIVMNKTGVYTCYALNTAGISASNANSQHVLTVTEDSTILCGENTYKFDIKWGITAEKTLVTLPCNGNYTGSVSRYCNNGGKWMEPNYSQCMHKAIQNIQAQSAKLLSGESVDTVVSTILENLENATSENTELRSGDLVASSAVLDDIVKYVTNHTDKLSVNQLEIFGSVCNNILDERNHQLWEELNNERSNGVPSVVKAVTDYNEVYHKVIDGEFAMIVQKENIVIEVGKTISDEITVPDRLKTSLSWIKDSATEIKLKKSIHNDLTGYSSTFYRNISRFFPNYLMVNGELQSFNGSYDVNSIITDFTIESTISSDNILIIKFENLLENYYRPFCGFWDFDVPNTVNGAWSNFGSRLVESTDSYTICEYNHTTNFAVLMSPGRTPLSHNFALSLISAIGCGVSILFLVITIIIHYVLWRYVKNDRTKILMNLCVALILSYTIFLAGITRTEIKGVCTAIAVSLHYMFLTDFCLMLAEGIQIMRMVVIVFSTRPIVHWLLPLCWVLPGIIVGISVGVTELKGYGNQQFCWLSLESSLIWAFIGPALLIILINCVIFVIMVYKMMTSRGIAGKTLREKSRIGLKSICIILPLFGVTWVLGAFSVNDDLVVFQYLFAIFNSLQGLFICLFHCFFNKQVRQGYNHYQRRLHSKSTNSTNTDNTKRSSSHRQRYMYTKEESLKRTISTS
ncbi:uncharacterized protein LOC143080082 isoform X2 [Mytilus galloprovincialis]|uniref:uncharacterized protein LOC143080082 isoform X2 n=1 Tax=Mytilus galloprovincialis TaxID=29158 RepID=UPI003F7C52CF